MDLTLTVDAVPLINRPLIGLAPWLYPPDTYERWQKLQTFLEYLNPTAYHFHMTHAVYHREIPVAADGLAGRLERDYGETEPGEFAGLMRAMRFAKQAGASLHMITGRPNKPYPEKGPDNAPTVFAKKFSDHMKPFSIRGYISCLAEFIRYCKSRDLPIQIVNIIDEPRWFFLNADNPGGGDKPAGAYAGIFPDGELVKYYPQSWNFAYTFLDSQLKARGKRAGVHIQILSDGYGHAATPDDVARLLSTPEVTRAANELCLVIYGGTRADGPGVADENISLAHADMARTGVNRQIFFKDMGGTRVEVATMQQEFAYGIDSIAGALRAFRQGVDFCGQYFFLQHEQMVGTPPEPHRQMFAAAWDEEAGVYAARRPLATLALFCKTQKPGAHRMKDHAGANVPGVDYLTLLSKRGTPDQYYTYYFVNRSQKEHAVHLTPARHIPDKPLYRYWLNYGFETGRTIQAQPLASTAQVRVPLPPRSMTALTERQVTDLNWSHQARN